MIDRASVEERLFPLALAILERMHGRDGMARGMAEYAVTVETEAKALGERPVACRAGCPHCCVLNVTVLLPEAAAIAAWLDERLSPAEVAALVARLDRQRRLVRWMEDGERIRRQFRCPFLDSGGNCTIHPVRPLTCRGVTSLDRELCREALDPAEPDREAAVPMDMVNKLVMEEAFCAMGRALAVSGREPRGIELSAGVLAFLTRPELVGLLLDGGRFPQELWE